MNIYEFYDKPSDLISWNKHDPENLGIIEFKKDGKLHQIDGPAIEYLNGSKAWYINGELHRTDGPAKELSDGHKAWYLHGKRHRVDGPAIEYSDGYKAWYIHGKIQLNEYL